MRDSGMGEDRTWDIGRDEATSAVRAWRTRILNILLAVLAVVALPPVVITLAQSVRESKGVPSALGFVAFYLVLVTMAVLRGLDARLRAWIALLLGYAAAILALTRGGLAGDGRVYLLALPILGLVLVGVRSGLVFSLLSLVLYGLYVLFAQLGWLANWLVTPENPLALANWVGSGTNLMMFLVPIVLLLWSFLRFQQRTLTAEQRATRELARTSDLLRERAEELEEINRLQTIRQRVLSAVAEVNRAVISIRETQTLVSQVVEAVRAQFDLYYVGLFLLDETGDGIGGRYAVLEAGTGEPGRIMREQGYRLEVGGQSMVGIACARQQVRIAQDAVREPLRFDNPLLPDTQSEIALPLVAGDRILGVLDVQSTTPAAFSDEDIAALQLVADQVAVGLENARLFERAQANLEELSRLHKTMTGEAWQQFAAARPDLSRYQVGQSEVAVETWQRLFSLARSQGHSVVARLGNEDDGQHAMAIPIKFRGVPIGVLGIHRPQQVGMWQAEDIAFGEGLADRVGLALENARLLEETQRQAWREHAIREITDQVAASFDLDTILRTTMEQLGGLVGADGGYAELGVLQENVD